MNPLAHLLPALVTLLQAPPLTWDGADVPAEEHLPGNNAGHYVLLTQPTATALSGATGCKQWSCTALLDVVTQFNTDLLDSAPAESIATQVTDRVEGTRLLLPPGFDCGPARLELHSELRDNLGELKSIRRLLRYRWDVFYDGMMPAPLAGVRALTTGRLRAVH